MGYQLFYPHLGIRKRFITENRLPRELSVHGTKPFTLHGVLEQCSYSYHLVLGSSERSMELDSMILIGSLPT